MDNSTDSFNFPPELMIQIDLCAGRRGLSKREFVTDAVERMVKRCSSMHPGRRHGRGMR